MHKTFSAPMLLGFGAIAVALPVEAGSQGALTITAENDVFTDSDNNYTNGVGITWVSGSIGRSDPSFTGQWVRAWSFLPYVASGGYQTYASWALTQEMNTPDDITEPTPGLDDQPYSGILSVDSTLYAQKPYWTHAWQLKLGIAGPASQADGVQREFHKLIGADKPMGWDTQLPNEPIINLSYSVAHLAATGQMSQETEWRLVPLGTIGIGNYFTGAGVGIYGEIGWNLVDALGVTALRSGLNAASTVGVSAVDGWSLSLFGGIGGYAVAHYLPLDGTLFRDSRSVDSNPLIGIISYGFCLRRNNFVLSFSKTAFSETFDTQRQSTDFGTVGVSWIL